MQVDLRVRHGHFLPPRRADARGKDADRGDLALDVVHADVFPPAYNTAVEDVQPAGRLREDARSGDGRREAREHGNALERVGMRAGQERKGKGEGEEPECQLHEPARRHRRIRVERADLLLALLDAREEDAREADQGARGHDDDGDHGQARNRVNDGERDLRDEREDVVLHLLAPGTRIRQELEQNMIQT